jgi:hypothetical protein
MARIRTPAIVTRDVVGDAELWLTEGTPPLTCTFSSGRRDSNPRPPDPQLSPAERCADDDHTHDPGEREPPS